MTFHKRDDESMIDFRIRQVESEIEVATQFRDWDDVHNLRRRHAQLINDKEALNGQGLPEHDAH